MDTTWGFVGAISRLAGTADSESLNLTQRAKVITSAIDEGKLVMAAWQDELAAVYALQAAEKALEGKNFKSAGEKIDTAKAIFAQLKAIARVEGLLQQEIGVYVVEVGQKVRGYIIREIYGSAEALLAEMKSNLPEGQPEVVAIEDSLSASKQRTYALMRSDVRALMRAEPVDFDKLRTQMAKVVSVDPDSRGTRKLVKQVDGSLLKEYTRLLQVVIDEMALPPAIRGWRDIEKAMQACEKFENTLAVQQLREQLNAERLTEMEERRTLVNDLMRQFVEGPNRPPQADIEMELLNFAEICDPAEAKELLEKYETMVRVPIPDPDQQPTPASPTPPDDPTSQ